ncbi:MAG: dockerin type I repeat-containing protein, partial [Clostridia bacterium]|nr:dockerin type I repeat-containing protein [Clostridia bacterium]
VSGDVNGDGAVNAMDVNVARRLISGSVTPSAAQNKAGDVNGDGTFNGIDANLLARFASGIISSFNK